MSGVKRLPVLFPFFDTKVRKVSTSGNSRVISVPKVWAEALNPVYVKTLALRQYLVFWPLEFDPEPEDRRAVLRDLALTALEAWAAIEEDDATKEGIAKAWVILKELEDGDPSALYGFVEDQGPGIE